MKKSSIFLNSQIPQLLFMAALSMMAGCQTSSVNDPIIDPPDASGAKLAGLRTFNLIGPTGDSRNLAAGNLTFTEAALHTIRGAMEERGYQYVGGPSADFFMSVTWEYGLDKNGPMVSDGPGSEVKPSVRENTTISVVARKTNTHVLLWQSPPQPPILRNALTEAEAQRFARAAMEAFPSYAPSVNKAP